MSEPLAGDAAKQATAVLSVRDLTVTYNGTPALEGVSLDVYEGERVAVVGPNGAGKSTLLKALVGMLRPAAGSILRTGHAEIGFVAQRASVDWSFPVTVFDAVLMGRVAKIGWLRWQRPRDGEIARRSLAEVGMLELAGAQIAELSGGQQQRVFIARALAQEANILLMDEPFAGVDAPSQEAILAILDDLRRRRVTVLLSTHDLNLAVDRFDRLALLNRRLVGYGPPRDLITPAILAEAYGGKALWRGDDYAMVLGDIGCCDAEGHVHD